MRKVKKRRLGRPPKENPRIEKLELRLTVHEKAKVAQDAESHGKTLSNHMRNRLGLNEEKLEEKRPPELAREDIVAGVKRRKRNPPFLP